MSLLDTTQKLLDELTASGLTLREIARASDGGIELQWLYRFSRGEIANPGVITIQSAHDCLKKIKPKAATAA